MLTCSPAALAGSVTEDVALPLIQELISAVDTATTALGSLTPAVPAVAPEKRDASETVAKLLNKVLAVRFPIHFILFPRSY